MADPKSIDEPKVYYIIREDMADTLGDLIAMIGTATISLWDQGEGKPGFEAYRESVSKPKVGLRAKNDNAINKALEACLDTDFPLGFAFDYDGIPCVVALGPVLRADLPKSISGLQLFAKDCDQAQMDALSDGYVPLEGQKGLYRLLVRKDIVMPIGKMAAQVGHAVWTGLETLNKAQLNDLFVTYDHFEVISVVAEDIERLEENSNGLPFFKITDEGRTVFNEPTVTVAIEFLP